MNDENAYKLRFLLNIIYGDFLDRSKNGENVEYELDIIEKMQMVNTRANIKTVIDS